MGGKIIPRIRLTSAKDLVEVEAELGNTHIHTYRQKLTCALDKKYLNHIKLIHQDYFKHITDSQICITIAYISPISRPYFSK